jgi:hypothetical protein
MPKNIDITTDQSQLQYIAAPTNTGLMEHKDVSSLVIGALSNKGFGIQSEEYRISVNKEVVQGVLHLIHPNNDPESVLMFTWVNSYDKTTGFRCEMGASNVGVNALNTEFFIEFDTKVFRRNSTDLVNHTKQHVEERIDEGLNNFKKFIAVRDKLKVSAISEEEKERMMGTFFFKDAITSSQLITLKNSFKLPHIANVWSVWCEVTKTFKSCHPKAWFKQQAAVSQLLMDRYITPGATVDPAQTDIVCMIEEHPIMDENNTKLDTSDGIEFEPQLVPEEALIAEDEKPKVLSLVDYDLATKENNEIKAEALVESAEMEEQVPEPVEESPVLSLDDYEPSDFPVAPEELPVWNKTNEDEDKNEQSSHSESERETSEDATLAEEVPANIITPIHESVQIIEPQDVVQQTSEETTDLEAQLTSVSPGPENMQEEPIPSGPDQGGEDQRVQEAWVDPVDAVPLEEKEDTANEEYSEVEDNNSNEATLESPNFEF